MSSDTRTVKIIDRNEFYNANGQDAELIAQSVLKSKTSLKHGDGDDVYVTLTKAQFELVIRELVLSLGYCVEVYTGVGKANYSEKYLQAKISPGNFGEYEDLLLGVSSQSSAASPVVAAVRFSQQQGSLTVGIASVDPNSRKMVVLEIVDDEKLANLETVLVQLGVRECLAVQGEFDQEKLLDICMVSNIHLTYKKKSEFDSKDITQDMNKLIRFPKGASKNSAVLSEMKLEIAMSALSAVIRFLDLLGTDAGSNQFKLETFDPRLFMRLDASAVVALGLTPKPGEAQSSFGSLFALLNHCRTQSGARLLMQWIKQPLIDIEKINRRLDLVEVFATNHELRRDFHETHLRGVQDLQRLGKKFVSKKATLQDLYKVYQTVQRLPKMLDLLSGDDTATKPAVEQDLISPLREAIEDFVKYQELVETTIDFDYFNATRDFRVKPEFDEGLADKREALDSLEKKANRALNDCMGVLEVETVKLEVDAKTGYCYRLTLKDEKHLRDKRSFTIAGTSKGGGVLFRDKTLAALSDEFIDINKEYEEQQRGIVDEIVGIASGYAQSMFDLANLLSTIDVFVAMSVAAVSAPIPFVRPKLLPLGGGVLRLEGVRHPCVEAQLGVSTFISNDIAFCRTSNNNSSNGENAADGPSFYIITGPNMGGKSTFLRSVALACLMAQMGSFVAADSAEIALVDAILARVGASDCIVRGVSTFMAEMLDTSVILKLATRNSLVIIDELGRGTSTYDGFGLAWAVSEHLVTNVGCFVLFATHFHELTRLANEYPHQVSNLHVSTHCDASTSGGSTGGGLTFLYKLKPGPCGKSLGLQVAKMVNFPEEVLQTARDWANGLQVAVASNDSAATVSQFSMAQVEEAENRFADLLQSIKALPTGDGKGDTAFKKLREDFRKKVLEEESTSNPFLQSLVRNEPTES